MSEPQGDWVMTDPLREAAEKVVEEIKADMHPDRDSDHNMAPYPDPVAALLAFARLIKES